MCLVRSPKIPQPKEPAAPAPPPERSAADVQGAPENDSWGRLNRQNAKRNSLRIDRQPISTLGGLLQ